MHPGPLELGIIFAIILMVFGVGKLPSVAKHLGEGVRAMRKGLDEEPTEGGDG